MQTGLGGKQSLSVRKVLGGIVEQEALVNACRELAASLARELGDRGLVYQEVLLEVETEDGTLSAAGRFARHQSAANLHIHLERMVSRLCVPAPAEGLVVAAAGLARGAAEQLTLFDGRDPLREFRLQRAREEVNRKYALIQPAALGVDRRERMLSFYDPFRIKRGGG
ncbi:MAG: hypothetical protein AB1374_11350 [Bacillota bacterium]